MSHAFQKIDPYGLTVAHTWAEIGVLLDVVNRFQLMTFVELGVDVGGLTAILHPLTQHKPGFRYLAVDINLSHTADTVKSLTGQSSFSLLPLDCQAPESVAYIKRYIDAQEGRALVYCDNGDKPVEFGLYAPIIRPGDLIGVHDFGEYEASAWWPGSAAAEIHEVQITDAVRANGLLRTPIEQYTRIALFQKAG